MIPENTADNISTTPATSGRRFSLRWLLLVAAILLLWRLDYAPFWNPDEGRYAAASMEMATPLDRGEPDWVVPHLNTLPRLNKPPLVYWTTAISFGIFGLSEWAARLVPALAAIGVMLVVWRLGRSMFGDAAGVLCALVWATSAFPFAMARTLNTDMLLCLSTAITLCGMWWAIGVPGPSARGEEPSTSVPRRWSAFVITGLGMGLALLAKGPVGMALPLVIGFVYLCLARGWGGVRWAGIALAVVVALAVAAPWYWAIEQREAGFLRHFIVGENLGRFSGGEDYHDANPFWFYLPVILLGLLPWSAFLPQAAARWQWEPQPSRRAQWLQWALWAIVAAMSLLVLVRLQGVVEYPSARAQKSDLRLVNTLAPLLLLISIALRFRLRRDLATPYRARLLFLWLWALLPVVLFSLSSTKLITYVLLSFPAFGLLLGEAVSSMGAPLWQSARRDRVSMIVTVLLNGVLAIAAIIFLAGNRTVPREIGLPWALGGCAVLVVCAALGLWAWRGATPQTLVRRVAGAQLAAAGLLFLFLIAVAGRIAPYEDASQMIKALRPHLREDDRFVEFKTFQPTAIFYLRRPVPVIDFVNTSGLDPEEFSKSQYFLPRAAARVFLRQPQRVFALVRWKHIKMKELEGAQIVGRNNDFYIVSNQPKPAGFDYDLTAPRKRNRPIPANVDAER